MKKILLLFMGISSFGFSQISITSANLPAVNDTLRISKAVIDQTLDFQTTGANQTWDFSNLQFNGQKLNEYKPVSGTGMLIQIVFGTFAPEIYHASYYVATDLPLNNLPPQLPITIKDACQFYKLTPDSMTMVGLKLSINNQEVPAKSDTIEVKYHFPIEFGDAHTSRGATKLNLNPIYDGKWSQHRYRETEVDGWGTITTPYGTFNSLRIHHRILETDSFYVSFSGFGTWINIPVPESHEYEWRVLEEKEPILLVKTSMVQGTENITAVEYRNEFTVGLDEKELLVALYPNPVQDLLVVASEQPFDTFSIFGTDGKEILSAALPAASQQLIDVSSLKKGTYLIRLQSDKGTAVKSFVK